MITLVIALVATLAIPVLGAPNARIVGGEETSIEEQPYVVSVLLYGSHYCGGSIIHLSWVVSAAHCFTKTVSDYSVRVGSSVRNSGGEVIAANRILLHASYLRATLDYDIALMELVTPITSTSARAITLPEQGVFPSVGTTTLVSGWGKLSEGGEMPTNLNTVDVPIISQEECRSIYGESVVTDRMFCAGYVGVGGKDACQNDSGGPLAANGVLTGIVSWGGGCARPEKPGVYTKVDELRDWIRSNSGI